MANMRTLLLFSLVIFTTSVVAKPKAYEVLCTPFSSKKSSISKPIYDLFDRAKKSIAVSMFSFTDLTAARKLALAKNRGVKVQVIVDEQSVKGKHYSIVDFFNKFGIHALVYSLAKQSNHTKLIVVDGKKTWMSTVNLSKKGFESNWEHGVLICSRPLAQFYTNDFADMKTVIKKEQFRIKKSDIDFQAVLKREKKQFDQELKYSTESKRK